MRDTDRDVKRHRQDEIDVQEALAEHEEELNDAEEE